jgi:hypothetical protein
MEKVIVEYNRDDIKEVKSTWDEDEANKLLASRKWIIMHAGLGHKDSAGFLAKPVYVLARIK